MIFGEKVRFVIRDAVSSTDFFGAHLMMLILLPKQVKISQRRFILLCFYKKYPCESFNTSITK